MFIRVQLIRAFAGQSPGSVLLLPRRVAESLIGKHHAVRVMERAVDAEASREKETRRACI